MNRRQAQREAHRIVALLIGQHLDSGGHLADEPADHNRLEEALRELANRHERQAGDR